MKTPGAASDRQEVGAGPSQIRRNHAVHPLASELNWAAGTAMAHARDYQRVDTIIPNAAAPIAAVPIQPAILSVPTMV